MYSRRAILLLTTDELNEILTRFCLELSPGDDNKAKKSLRPDVSAFLSNPLRIFTNHGEYLFEMLCRVSSEHPEQYLVSRGGDIRPLSETARLLILQKLREAMNEMYNLHLQEMLTALEGFSDVHNEELEKLKEEYKMRKQSLPYPARHLLRTASRGLSDGREDSAGAASGVSMAAAASAVGILRIPSQPLPAVEETEEAAPRSKIKK